MIPLPREKSGSFNVFHVYIFNLYKKWMIQSHFLVKFELNEVMCKPRKPIECDQNSRGVMSTFEFTENCYLLNKYSLVGKMRDCSSAHEGHFYCFSNQHTFEDHNRYTSMTKALPLL